MTDFLQLLISGTATGAIYALAALGFTLLWQASGTINFAQGEFVMVPAFVGEVVMEQEITPFLAAARARGCAFQVGTDMLFEQSPAYLEFFGFPSATAEELRGVARISY